MMEEKVEFVKEHYEQMGYRVHSGLQFGAELVLYADRPDLVHSDFCINVTRDGKFNVCVRAYVHVFCIIIWVLYCIVLNLIGLLMKPIIDRRCHSNTIVHQDTMDG